MPELMLPAVLMTDPWVPLYQPRFEPADLLPNLERHEVQKLVLRLCVEAVTVVSFSANCMHALLGRQQAVADTARTAEAEIPLSYPTHCDRACCDTVITLAVMP
jgi:hypothetical protein